MGLTSFARFQELIKQKHHPRKMGFKADTKDINILSHRMRLARSFRGLNLDGYSDHTARGYDALFRVFLTHAALERYCVILGFCTKTSVRLYDPEFLKLTVLYGSERVIRTFIEHDRSGKFQLALSERLHDAGVKQELDACKEGKSCNVPALSSSIRHIFSHGHLTANAKGVRIKDVCAICDAVATFNLAFIDGDFTRRIDVYCERIGYVPRGKTSSAAEDDASALDFGPTKVAS